MIPYELRETGRVRITIFSTLGQEIRTLVDAVEPAGRHRVRWNGQDQLGNPVASGVYLYRFQADGLNVVKKAILLK